MNKKIAHVGSECLEDENDRWHLDAIFSWLMKTNDDYTWLYVGREDDLIDLNAGRDFLLEDMQYDIIILHMVYSPAYKPEENWRRHTSGSPSIFKTSRHHTKENWKSRLLSTGAKYIFTFGNYSEVSTHYLGMLDGYNEPIDAGNYLHVYVKN